MKNIYVYLILLVLVIGGGLFFMSNISDKNSPDFDIQIGKYQSIKPEEAIKLIGTEDVFLIDVRTIQEFNSGHIVGSLNIPLDNLGEIVNFVDNKDSIVIVYCRSGNRSRTAANTLIENGYTRVLDLGGINSWPYEVTK